MKEKLMRGSPSAFGKLFFSLFLLLIFSGASFSQTVTGTVTDDNNQPVPGVTVQVKNTNRATISNITGKYEINASANDVLEFSYVGTPTQTEAVGNRKIINIHVAGSAQNLREVVVTALGIKKQSRGLGYAATSVNPDEVSVNRTPNVMNALQGKVAGVNISSLGTGPGGTSKIRIRGQASISGQNNPLIVINGVPIDKRNFNEILIGVTGGGVYADGGDGLSSINPDDIETMTILKGAPASALYGSRAQRWCYHDHDENKR